jgi:phosphoribosylanthranilate isomerase
MRPDAGPVWVKVCGMTRTEDVAAAIAAGADAIGIAMLDRSRRAVDTEVASLLATSAVGRVEVFLLVDGAPEAAVELAHEVGATGVQPYGPEAGGVALAALEAGLTVLFPIPVAVETPVDLTSLPAGARPLLDTAVAGLTGGTGRTFEWDRAQGVSGAVIAGGLNPDNVAVAVATARPWGVDASSGLEAEVGIKDHSKVMSFVQAAKAS